MKQSIIMRCSLWFVWSLFSVFYIYPKYMAKGMYTVTGSLMDWISQHSEGLILIMWAVITLALFVEILLKITKDEDAKREKAMQSDKSKNKKEEEK
jgi:hypothetical protein